MPNGADRGLLTSSSVEGQGIENQGSDLADPGANGGQLSAAGVSTVPQAPCSTDAMDQRGCLTPSSKMQTSCVELAVGDPERSTEPRVSSSSPKPGSMSNAEAVSYTHLTLPTTPYV